MSVCVCYKEKMEQGENACENLSLKLEASSITTTIPLASYSSSSLHIMIEAECVKVQIRYETVDRSIE